MANHSLASLPHSSFNETNANGSSNRGKDFSTIHYLCFLFLDGEIEKSVIHSLFWCLVSVVSLILNALECHYFWLVKNSLQIHEVLLLNLFACHMAVGYPTQIMIAVLYLRDSCLLRAMCVIGTVVTTHFSLISLTFLSFNQYYRISKLSRNIVPEVSYARFHHIFIPVTWIYCFCFALLKVIYPSSVLPIAFLFFKNLILIAMFLFSMKKLQKIRRNVIGIENAEDRGTMVSLANQIDDASKTILTLLAVMTITWLPATLITLTFRFGAIAHSSKMHIALKIGLFILFLAPSLDVICLLVKFPRIRQSIKQKLTNLLSLLC